MKRTRRAFTLIELLVVMAISSVLLGLIVYPLVQSFNLTLAGQAFSEAQDDARILTDRIAREIGNAALVRSASAAVSTTLNGANTTVPQNSLIIKLPNQLSTATAEVVLPFSKLDLLRPAEGDQSQIGSGQFSDPVNAVGVQMQDPTLHAPKGQVILPMAPGFTMVRYLVALRNPFVPYNNPYDGILMAQNGGRDNLYVIYRAEIQPYVLRAGVGTNGDTSVTFRPNRDYFQSDSLTDTVPSGYDSGNDGGNASLDRQDGIDDPRFACADIAPNGAVIQDAHNARIYHWLLGTTAPWENGSNLDAPVTHVSSVQTEVSRFDMILPVYDKRTHKPQYDQNGVPRIVPLVQFRPERVSNDPAVAQVAVRQGQESDTAGAAAADVFLTQYGLWTNSIVRTFPQGWDPTSSTADNYLVGLIPPGAGNAGNAPGFSVYGYNESSGAEDYAPANLTELFDVYTYTRLLAQKTPTNNQVYPFTAAVLAAHNRSQWLAEPPPANMPNWRQIFTPYWYDADRGKVIASFNIDEVGNAAMTPTDPDNLPSLATAATVPYSPQTDPTDMTQPLDSAIYSSINEKFNKVGHDYPSLLPDNVHRFIDLRVVPNSDGTLSPLYPTAMAGLPTGFNYIGADGGQRSKVQIVPGSEIVQGPDQINGPHYGEIIRYTRITVGDPGPNQYKINYADKQEPLDSNNKVTAAGYGAAGTFAGVGLGNFNPLTYDPTNVFSAVLQPRFKVGYLQLNSDPNAPLPFTAGGGLGTQSIRVSYKFQFTGTRSGTAVTGRTTTDAFAVDYDTRQLMSVLLTIRNYPQSSLPNPQSVTLKSTATVRNYTR